MTMTAHTVTLRDASKAELRRLTLDDVQAVAAFLRTMPERDLLFFRQDISSDEVIRGWAVDHGGSPETIATVAVRNGRIIGLAYVRRRAAAWIRHVGDVVAIVDRSLRGRGLGTLLLREALLRGAELGLEKIVARIVVEDREIVQIFERLGFRQEGILLDHARDRNGTLFDLTLMGLDLRRHRSALERTESTEIDLSRRDSLGGA
jgi:RimJ/RimL family protein N-acetyltransferase